MKTCEDYELAASFYVDGELEPSERTGLFNHMAGCERCARFLEQAIRIRLEVAKEQQHQPAEEIIPLLMRAPDGPAVRRVWRRSLRAVMQRRLSIPVTVAGAIGFLLVIGTLVFSSLALRMQEPKTVFVVTLPGIEVEARNP
jgi:anti-sigma factor RsiW